MSRKKKTAQPKVEALSIHELIKTKGKEALPNDLAKKTGAKTWNELIVQNAYRQALKSPQFFQALRPRVKKRPRGKPFERGNIWRFPEGVSGNPGGRPRVLGETATQKLSHLDPETKKTVAELIIEAHCERAVNGAEGSFRELRLLTEGETVHTPDMLQVFMDK